MNILFYTIALRHGGAERCMSILANVFAEEGHSVSFVQNDAVISPAYAINRSIPIFTLGGVRFSHLASVVEPFFKLRRLIKKISPDVIVTFFPDTATIARIASLGLRIPIIFSERNDPQRNLRGWKMKLFQSFAVNNSDWLVFQTEGVRQYYTKYINKSCVILNPCDSSLFPDKPIRQRKEIVSVGRLEFQKNQSLLISAFSLLANDFPEFMLIIYGEGVLRDELEGLVRQYHLEDRVTLPGTRDDVIELISGSSLFVLTSDYEGLPNALIEAMALGLPCISTDCSPGGARELIVNGENGVIVPCNDEYALSEAIRYLLRNAAESERIGRAARRIRARTEPKVVSRQWIEVIKKVTNS